MLSCAASHLSVPLVLSAADNGAVYRKVKKSGGLSRDRGLPLECFG
jgi:hypothetical protein